MSRMKVWNFAASLTWVHEPEFGAAIEGDPAQPEYRASVVLADINRGELFSSSGSASAKLHPVTGGDWSQVVGKVFLSTELFEYAIVGRQFLVVRGRECEAVGNITHMTRDEELSI